MWIKNFINEWKAWNLVRKIYKENKTDFNRIGLKSDYFGRLYKVINRDPEIDLGSDEDEIYLRKELSEMTQFLIKHNIIDILAYELSPLEKEKRISEDKIEFEHGYLITFTPAWNLSRQYVSIKSVSAIIIVTAAVITGSIYLLSYLNVF